MSIDYIPKLKEWAVSGGLKKVFSFSVLSIPAEEFLPLLPPPPPCIVFFTCYGSVAASSLNTVLFPLLFCVPFINLLALYSCNAEKIFKELLLILRINVRYKLAAIPPPQERSCH
jgi:hypothetical protein